MTTPQLAWRLVDGATDSHRAWRLVAFGLGGLAVLSYYLPRPLPGALVFVPAQLLALGVLIAVTRWIPPAPARAWTTLAVGFSLIGASLVLVGFGLATVSELVSNPVRLVGYGLVVYGGVQLARDDPTKGNAAVILESLIVATAAATVTWFVLVQPELEAGRLHSWITAICALTYPSVDVALIILAVRTAIAQRRLLPYQWLIAVAVVVNTATDVGVFHGFTGVGYRPGQPSDLGLLLVIPLIAAAALHPSARVPLPNRSRGRPPATRGLLFAGLLGALLVPPAILIALGLTHPTRLHAVVPGVPSAEVEIAFAVITMALLVAARLQIGVREQERAAHVNSELARHNEALARAVAQTSEAILITNSDGTVAYANPAFELLAEVRPGESITRSATLLGALRPETAVEEMQQQISAGAPWRGDATLHQADGTDRKLEVSISPISGAADARLVTVARDVTAQRAAQRERVRLSMAVEQGSDSIIITDLTGTIEYVNPAFTRISGYTGSEVIGQNPRLLQSGRQSKAFYRALWRRLTGGEVWTGQLTNRRKDGELYEVEATISPLRGPDGAINGYLGVQRDVTALIAAQSALAGEFRERAAVVAALSRLQPRGSAEETAGEICDELAGLPGVNVAAIFTFQNPGRGLTLAVTGPHGLPVEPGRALPPARAAYLYERASQGPWAEAWRARPEDGSYGQRLTDLGVKAAAYAPIRNGEGLLGLVLAGTFDESFASHLVDHLPIVGEFAATASALLAGQVEQGRRVDVVRKRITSILATGAFHPVFQPVVELDSGRTVGHEALTRFDDGSGPDEVFADAQAGGLGLELEAACLAAAIGASAALSPDLWLSLNTSPDLILEPTTLAALIDGQPREIVLEITEHAAIADYAALRAALAALGPTVSLAVDDAGAGFASLHHVVELSPRYLKLDISLVRGVDRDPTRQAMVAGLLHFAGRAACRVIAEGIEEPAELTTLRGLGVALGQGYLLGRPGPLPMVAGGSVRHGRARSVSEGPIDGGLGSSRSAPSG